MEFEPLLQGRFLSSFTQLITKQRQLIKKRLSCCDLCGGTCQQNTLICPYCLNDLPTFNAQIIHGDLLNWPAVIRGFEKLEFDHLICLAPYMWPFDRWLNQFKYNGRFELAQLFAEIFTYRWCSYLINQSINKKLMLLAVPLHLSKWQQRGFNQAHLFAKSLATKMGIPYHTHALIRKKETKSQVVLGGSARRKNLRHAFSLTVKPEQLPSHVILVDDVVTTGTTANEITQLLKSVGVNKVTLLTLCLTLT